MAMELDTPEFKEKVFQLRQQGLSKENIAFELEVHKSIVYRILGEHDPKPAKKSRIRQILDLYDTGMTYEEIAKQMGVKKASVAAIASRYSETFQPVGKLNYRPKTTMTEAEQRNRRRLMGDFLRGEGIRTVVCIAMRGDLYRIEYQSEECRSKVLALFTKENIVRVGKYHTVVRKMFTD